MRNALIKDKDTMNFSYVHFFDITKQKEKTEDIVYISVEVNINDDNVVYIVNLQIKILRIQSVRRLEFMRVCRRR